MIKPTIGRVVWYRPSIDHNCVYAAIIARVWSDTCVNLAIFDENGNPYNKTSVLLYQEGNPRPDYDFAEWMPYQKGQAIKTEELEKKLGEKEG